MDFCKKCGSLMLPQKDKNKVILVCSSCKTKQKGGEDKMVEKIRVRRKVEAVDVQVKGTMPTTDADCQNCGNNKAYYRSEQTRAADEPETLFFTCTKCGKTWREYE